MARQALARLDELDLLGKGDLEGYFVYLSAILREFVERRFGLRAPERTTEEFLREAQAAGLRVIASEIGGIPELSTTARWVPPDDDDALLSALQAESRLGRRRLAPRSYADPNEHAAGLLGRYRAWARDAQLEPVPDSR